MATIRDQFQAAKVVRDQAQTALNDINAQLEDCASYRTWRELTDLERKSLKAEKELFRQAGILAPDGANFSQLRQEWTKHLKPLSDAWHSVDTIEGRLSSIKRQLRQVDIRQIRSLLNDQAKLSRDLRSSQVVYTRLRDALYPPKSRATREEAAATREENHEMAVAIAPEVVVGVLARLDHPVRNRGQRRNNRTPSVSSGKKTEKTKGTKAEQRKTMMAARRGSD